MPAFLTHWRTLIETADLIQANDSAAEPPVLDAATRRQRNHGWATPPQTTAQGAIWNIGPFPAMGPRFPGCDISSMAFLGALAPDIFYYQSGFSRELSNDPARLERSMASWREQAAPQWSDLWHCAHTGDLFISFLEQVAQVPSPALRSQALTFALGYLSHIATDMAVQPWLRLLTAHLSGEQAATMRLTLEQGLDETLAIDYFGHARYQFLHQPWEGYIKPVAGKIERAGEVEHQLLQLLIVATEIYQSDEKQVTRLAETFLSGLQGLRTYLAGQGKARWEVLRSRKQEQSKILHEMPTETPHRTEKIKPEHVLHYATLLSVLLCKRAISYYTALRDPDAQGRERGKRRTALIEDLRNWNLYTGYDTDGDKQINGNGLHSWVHFANLWEAAGEPEAPALFSKTSGI